MKRLFLLLIVYCLLITPAWGVIVAGQQNGTSIAPAVFTQDLAFASTVTTGDFIVASGAMYAAPPISSLTVTADCGTLTLLTQDNGADLTVFIAYGFATSTGSCTITVASPDSFFPTFGIKTFTGVNSTPLDVDGGFTNSSGVSAVADITTVASNSLIIGIVGLFSGGGITPDSAYTEIYEEEDGVTYQGMSLIYRIVPTPSTYSVLWSLSSGQAWSAYTASFKPSGAVGGPVVRHRPIMQ